MGCLPDCAVVLTFEVDNDDLNNYTILTRGVPKRTGEMRLRRCFDDPIYEKGHGFVGHYWELGEARLLLHYLVKGLN